MRRYHLLLIALLIGGIYFLCKTYKIETYQKSKQIIEKLQTTDQYGEPEFYFVYRFHVVL